MILIEIKLILPSYYTRFIKKLYTETIKLYFRIKSKHTRPSGGKVKESLAMLDVTVNRFTPTRVPQ